MLVYLFLLGAVLILNIMRKNGSISNKSYCVIICALFVLVTGLRHNSVGSDTTGYYLSFYGFSGRSLAQIIALDKRDMGFYIFEWFIYQIIPNFNLLATVAACVFYVPITILIYRYSDDYGLSYLTLMAFMFFQFSMTGIRQTMALGMAVLFFLELFDEEHWSVKKILRISLWIYLGIMFHRSFIIMLPMLIIRLFKDRKGIAWVCVLLTPIIFLMRGRITSNLLNIFNSMGFDLTTFEGTSGGVTTLFVYVLLLIMGMFFTYQEDEYGGMPAYYLIILSIAVLLQNFVLVNSIFFRVVWYYSIFMVIYIPKLVTSFRTSGQSASLLNTVFYLGLLYMYLGITIGSATVLPYRFFWQGI